jgi:hypothetical protein
MGKEKSFSNSVWIIMMVLSIIFIILTSLMLSDGGVGHLSSAFRLAGSSQSIDDIEIKALGFMGMAMLKPLWEEMWIGIFGLFIAFGLRKNKKYALTLGIFWGIMMITNAAIQGGYEVFILGWSNACIQTYIFLLLGLIALISLLIFRKVRKEPS